MESFDAGLAAALSGRLAHVVPRPASVRADGEEIGVYVGDEPWGGIGPLGGLGGGVDENGERFSLEEDAEMVARQVLSTVQDCVAEVTGEEWPRLPGGGMALPDARCDGDRLFLWYGPDERSAALTLEPIPLAGLRLPRQVTG